MLRDHNKNIVYFKCKFVLTVPYFQNNKSSADAFHKNVNLTVQQTLLCLHLYQFYIGQAGLEFHKAHKQDQMVLYSP